MHMLTNDNRSTLDSGGNRRVRRDSARATFPDLSRLLDEVGGHWSGQSSRREHSDGKEFREDHRAKTDRDV